jgi:uncharacterized membrane protein
MQYVVAYLVTALAFGAMDAVWLNTMFTRLYKPEIGELLGELRWAPALIFYFLYLIGMQIFAVAPALKSGQWTTALLYGALLGFFCYATYDLTNHATMKVWSIKVTIIDIIWGTFATGTASAIAAWVTLRFFPATGA